mmetsp:Transcript_10273/g.19432  ORF Transcript_10273/g.19432 Transcript_10273/m.19432 type:complete len:267 (+) Transcript_10273:563-1363(+)
MSTGSSALPVMPVLPRPSARGRISVSTSIACDSFLSLHKIVVYPRSSSRLSGVKARACWYRSADALKSPSSAFISASSRIASTSLGLMRTSCSSLSSAFLNSPSLAYDTAAPSTPAGSSGSRASIASNFMASRSNSIFKSSESPMSPLCFTLYPLVAICRSLCVYRKTKITTDKKAPICRGSRLLSTSSSVDATTAGLFSRKPSIASGPVLVAAALLAACAFTSISGLLALSAARRWVKSSSCAPEAAAGELRARWLSSTNCLASV